jgi:hypothetical protein
MMFNEPRFRYPESGRFAQRGEDSVLLSAIYDEVPIVAVSELGHLYLYTYHGRNTFDRAHHHRLSIFSRTVDDLTARFDDISGAMAQYPVPRPFMVVGRDGPAFMLN